MLMWDHVPRRKSLSLEQALFTSQFVHGVPEVMVESDWLQIQRANTVSTWSRIPVLGPGPVESRPVVTEQRHGPLAPPCLSLALSTIILSTLETFCVFYVVLGHPTR